MTSDGPCSPERAADRFLNGVRGGPAEDGSRARVRIGLFGPYSSRNLGDTATQMAVMENLRSRLPGVEFIGICAEPADAARTHRIPAADMSGATSRILHPDCPEARSSSSVTMGRRRLLGRLRRLLPGFVLWPFERLARLGNVVRVVGRIDVLLVSGGGQIDDFWGGAWGRPYELLVWCLACIARRRKVAVFGTGLDNLTSRLGRFLAFTAMRLAHYRMFRDQETLDVLRQAGVRKPSSVAPDPAFSLSIDPSWGAARPPGGRIVLVCPIAASAWQRVADEPYQNYLDALTDACARLAQSGAQLQLSNTQTHMDVPVVEALAAKLRERAAPGAQGPRIRLASTVREFCAIASSADVVVASRLHGVILPIVVGTPVVAISYMRKVSRFMADSGMAGRCLEVRQISSGRLAASTFEALADAAAIRAQLAALNRRFRAELSAEYDAVVRLTGSAPLARE